MIALHITNIKQFMNRLFLCEDFDAFRLSEATFVTFGTFHIDGLFQIEYYSSEELEEMQFIDDPHLSWRQARPFALTIIKGKHTPLEFKIVFRLSCANVQRLLQQSGLAFTPGDVSGLFLNLHFQAGCLTCTTGTALRTFTLDKSLDRIWDEMITRFFLQKNISFEKK